MTPCSTGDPRSSAAAAVVLEEEASGASPCAPSPAPLVLVVDDYEDTLEIVKDTLELAGFRTESATTGLEALEKAFAVHPDVVLMDLSLPRMDGWEATRRLKADPRTKDVLVVALTAHAVERHAESAREAGCDAYVSKPCLPEELTEAVWGLLASRAKARG